MTLRKPGGGTKSRILVIGVVAVLAMSLGGLYLFRQHEHAVQRAAAISRDNVLKTALADDAKYDAQADRARRSFEATIALASRAGTLRHDNAVSRNRSSSFQEKWARIERSAVEKADIASAAQMGAIARSLQVYEGLYGADAVRGARTEAANFREARSIQLAEWGSAIRGIVDLYRIDEEADPIALQSLADHYSKSEQNQIHADRFENALLTEETRLVKRIADERRTLLTLR